MSYFAAALAKSDGEWQGVELDLDDIEMLDELADAALEIDSDDGLVIVCVESDDWFGVVRVDETDEPRVYLSDAFEANHTALGELLLSDIGVVSTDDDSATEPEEGADDDDDLELSDALPARPVGDAGLLDDVGVGAADLQLIATKTGLTPTDAISEIADRLGAGSALEELR